jgi:hypothetical protein
VKKICRIAKRFFKEFSPKSARTPKVLYYDTRFCRFRQRKDSGSTRLPLRKLLLAERHAVGTLVNSGVGLMGTHHDPLQGAVVLGVAMVSALLDGTLDALVSIVVHFLFLLCFGVLHSMQQKVSAHSLHFSAGYDILLSNQ